MELNGAIEKLNKFTNIKTLYGSMIGFTTSQYQEIKESAITVLQHIKHLQKENERYKRIKPVSIDGEYEIDIEEFLNVSDKLYELERNSISKDKIREKIDNRISIVEKMLDEMIDKSIGCINVSLLNKKEKEEVINKRNCLTVQKATLEDIKKDLLKEG